MPKRLLKLIAVPFLVLLCFTSQAGAQSSKVAEREAEWQSYKLPASDFRRHLHDSKRLLFRAPADWQQQGDQPIFKGPSGTEFHAIVEEIPDGLDLKSYVAAVLQGLRGLPEGPDSITTRRVQMSGLEAREILFQTYDIRGDAFRRVIWTAVEGPTAVTFLLVAPLSHIAEVETYFKGITQSAIMLSSPSIREMFEMSRSKALIEDKPARIDEVQSCAETLDGLDPAAREKAIEGLAKIYASSPDVAIDLLLDSRTMVLSGAVEAIGLSGNESLVSFLFNALSHHDLFVSDRAARAISRLPNSGKLLSDDWKDSPVVTFQETLRAAAYLDKKERARLATELFKVGAKKYSEFRRAAPPPPPPAPKKRASRAPGKEPPPEAFISAFIIDDLYLNEQFIAINLLRYIPAGEFAMPLAQIIASKSDRMTAAALQVALERREPLPLPALLPLLDSSNEEIRRLAVLHIGQSAAPSDIKQIEARAQKLSTKRPYDATRVDLSEDWKAKLAEDLRLSIEKVKLREQIAASEGEARRDLIQQAMKDARLADWAWSNYLRDELEGPKQMSDDGANTSASDQSRANKVQPLGENLFPEQVTLYAALPDLSVSINRLGDALNNIQMDSAQGQASFVFILNSLKLTAARFFGAPPDGATLDYIGIDPAKPIAIASWTAEGAPRGLPSAKRQAAIARVRDRDRFERTMSLYHSAFGDFESLTENISLGARVFSLIPAFLPLGGAAAMSRDAKKPEDPTRLIYRLTGRDTCNGYPVKIIEQVKVNYQGAINRDAIYLAYVGDAAVLAPDWYSLRDALSRADANKSGIALNAEFKRAVEAGGDIIYLSNVSEVFANPGEMASDGSDRKVMESGALRISNETLENSFNISFKENEWPEALLPFKPEQRMAPRELLPRSTVMYLLADLDITNIWRKWAIDLFGKDDAERIASVWAMDFEKEIMPELGNESGVALLELPNFASAEWDIPIVFFFKLKSDKLGKAYRDGKLFRNISTASSPARVKITSSNFEVAIKNGYLIFALGEGAIGKLDQKEKLAEARDFIRAIKNAPPEVVAFGSYNLEAAIAGIVNQNADADMERFIRIMGAVAGAFHSQIFYALPNANGIAARTSVSLDREGRYSVAELSSLSKDARLTYAVVEARGVPIADQKRLDNLKLRIRSKGAGTIDRIREDVASAHQTAEKRSEEELLLSVRPRRLFQLKPVQLPVTGAEFAPFLKPTREIRSQEQSVIEKAKEIVGDDRDAWSVARKLADWTYKNLKWKRVDRADAAHTLATLEADCSEFSDLFVAMARSVGLPARLVSGMAYSGNSFGGHAWAEVYVGEWIEMDPTWGTDFVDATHIRGEAGELMSYAALNLIEIEVLEATRGVPDYQRDATALAEKLCEELPEGKESALAVALDIATLTDQHMGAGAWAGMSDKEREQMFSAYHRMVLEISSWFEKDDPEDEGARLLKVSVEGDRAEALVIEPEDYTDLLVKIKLARVGDVWMLADVIQTDTGFHIISDSLQPAIRNVLDGRSGKETKRERLTTTAKILIALGQDANVALELADEALKGEPNNRDLRFLKSYALLHSEKYDEAKAIWAELSDEQSPLAPALLKLAEYTSTEEEDGRKKAIELYERYLKMEPDDPRAHGLLAGLYRYTDDATRAEAEYREAIRCDPRHSGHYTDLAEFLADGKRYAEALAAIDDGAKHGSSKDELFTALLMEFYYSEESETAEELVAAQPERLEKNAQANYYLAQIRIDDGRPREALPLLKKSVELDPDNAETQNSLAEAYRALREWRNALAAADAAIRIKDDDVLAHYHRACALAQLGRKTAAIAALKRITELNEYMASGFEEEEDLKPLARLAEFRKLLPKKDGDK